MANSNNINYFLGGYWTNGTARGMKWYRGRWSDGNWEKGYWYSYDLDLKWAKEDALNNEWSIWSGGIWRSNSQGNDDARYSFDDYLLDEEWSIWFGGRWQSQRYLDNDYTWQAEDATPINIYGSLQIFDCDVPNNGNTVRSMLLPKSRSVWLSGQWLRGVWEGGIFANGIWHSIPAGSGDYEYLDDLFFLYNEDEYPKHQNPNSEYTNFFNQPSIVHVDTSGNITIPLSAIVLYNDEEIFTIRYESESDYDEELSSFYEGAFVNSVWEGGTVYDTDEDPFVTMFGMSVTTNNKILFDDSGIINKYGFLESNDMLSTKMFGLNMPNWRQYQINTQNENSSNASLLMREGIIDNVNSIQYIIPNDYSRGGLYSSIWKRGRFKNGTFMYSHFYDYSVDNTFRVEYNSDPNILIDQSNYDSVFEKGLMYKSIFNNGLFLAQYSNNELLSSFSHGLWLTGYWAAYTEEYGSILPLSDFTDDRMVTNAKFWKSVWYSGIWEGGNAVMSVWNCGNMHPFNITINGNEYEPSSDGENVFANITNNPLGKTDEISYYDEFGQLLPAVQNIISDLNRKHLLVPQSVDNLSLNNLAIKTPYEYLYFYDGDEDSYIPESGTAGTSNGSYMWDASTPYDLWLENTDQSSNIGSAELVAPNNGIIPIVEVDAIEHINHGLILSGAEESSLNEDIVNEKYMRYTGLVDNTISVWRNGCFRGGVWNGGLWLGGIFEPYRYDDYPEIINSTGIRQYFDYFDDNITALTEKIDKPIWNRGIWYGGYFKGDSYMTSVPAYITQKVPEVTVDQVVDIDLNYKLGLSNSVVQSVFNSNSTSVLQLKSLNICSMFNRLAIKDSNTSNFYFSVFNGQLFGGYFADIDKKVQNKSISNVTPLFGTTTFAEDLESNLMPGFNMGTWKIDVGQAPNSFPIVISNIVPDYFLKNQSNASTFPTINIASPVMFNLNADEYTSDPTTGTIPATSSPYSDHFFYDWITSDHIPPNIPGPGPDNPLGDNNADIRHARISLTTQPAWSDVSPAASSVINVPSYAQGCGEEDNPEPYYKV
jgi:hypothetical protein